MAGKRVSPEFEEEPAEIWASVALTVLMVIVNLYASWAAYSIGAGASFHLTHGITASWLGIPGVAISVLATLLAWRGFGLNAVAAFLSATSLAAVLAGNSSLKLTASVLFAISWLVAAIWQTRRFYEHNPFLSFLALWGLTWASSLSQSLLYNLLFDHSYPLQGVLLLKSILFGLGGLTMLFAFPRKNKEYVI